MSDCLIGLGSNLEDRAAQLDRARDLLCSSRRIQLRAVSRYFQTSPVGGPRGQQHFLNAALRLQTDLTPNELFAWTQRVESDMGRRRLERWGPRVIDIDVLLYDRWIVERRGLSIPHPRMAIRRFVLEPACEVASDMVHAPTGWTLSRLRDQMNRLPIYVATAGGDAQCRRRVAIAGARQSGARLLLAPDVAAEQFSSQAGNECVDRHVVEILAARQRLLASTLGSGSADRPVIGDFWLHQSLANARTGPEGHRREQLEQRCCEMIETAPLPHFILLLDATSVPQRHASAFNAEESLGATDFSVSTLAGELRRLATTEGLGPVLRVPGGDVDGAVVELVAGIDAMR